MIAESMKKNEEKFVITLEEAQGIGGVEYLFFGGDMVTGYGERGLTGPDSLEHIKKFKTLLSGYFGDMPKKYMAGGHELGYVLPLSTDPEGGPSEKSIEIFEGNFNELFYTFEDGKYKFVVLSSDLELLRGGTDEMLRKKREQREFYKDEMTYKLPDQKVVLMLHDPDALASMFPFLKNNLGELERTFSGHQHAQWVNKIYPQICQVASSKIMAKPLKAIFNKMFPGKAEAVWKYFQDNKDNASIWNAVKLSIIPAPGGMMGVGGGFLVADLNEEGIKVHKINIPKRSSL